MLGTVWNCWGWDGLEAFELGSVGVRTVWKCWSWERLGSVGLRGVGRNWDSLEVLGLECVRVRRFQEVFGLGGFVKC